MISLPLSTWLDVCDRMEHDPHHSCPIIASTCDWLRDLVREFEAAGRTHMEIYQGGPDHEHVIKYCEGMNE